MEFCPKCGAILMLRKKNYGCPRCSYISKDKIKVETKESVTEHKKVAVIGEHQGEVRPITDHECKKCGHKKAYFWTRQMRASDEAESKFYECKKCKHTIRVDD